MYSKILVPLDGSELSETILPYACMLASALSLPMRLLHVLESNPGEGLIRSEGVRFERKGYLERVAGKLAKPLEVSCTIKEGTPAEVIVDHASRDERALVAMATRGRSGMKSWFVGSVADKVLQRLGNPLLLVKGTDSEIGGHQEELKRIMVPLDGSRLAEIALPFAVEIAKALGLKVELLRVYSLPMLAMPPAGSMGHAELIAGEALREEAETYLKAKLRGLKEQGVGNVSYLIALGEPGHEIIELAQPVPGTIIVLATHARSGVERWIIGSVAARVVHYSGDPVLIVRSAADEKSRRADLLLDSSFNAG